MVGVQKCQDPARIGQGGQKTVPDPSLRLPAFRSALPSRNELRLSPATGTVQEDRPKPRMGSVSGNHAKVAHCWTLPGKSTESKRCGQLRTRARLMTENPAVRPAAVNDQAGFRPDWWPEWLFNLVSFPGPVQFLYRESNPRPSRRPQAHPFALIHGHGDPPCGE